MLFRSNGGQVHVGMRRDQPWLEQSVGEAGARAFWRLALEAREHLDWAMETYGIDCGYRPGLIHADHKVRYVAQSREHVEFMRDRYGYRDLTFLSQEDLRSMLDSPAYYGGSFDARGGHLHAMEWALGLAYAAQSHGAQLHEGVEVLSVDQDEIGRAHV